MTLTKRQRRARRERAKAVKACRCIGRSGQRKMLYRSRGAALGAAMRGREGVPRVYRCPVASGWHVTRVSAGEGRREQK